MDAAGGSASCWSDWKSEMRIRTQILLVVVTIVAVVSVIGVLVASDVAFQGLKARENLEVEETLRRAGAAITMQVDQLARTSKDWAVWDDSYGFMVGRNPEFVQANLTTTALESLGVDFIGFVDRSGKVVEVVSLDASAGTVPSLPEAVNQMLASEPTLFQSGVAGSLAASQGPLILATQPITRSDGTGPSTGTFVIGKYLGKDEIHLLADLTGADVSVAATQAAGSVSQAEPAGSGSQSGPGVVIAPTSKDSVTGRTQVQGLDGKSAFGISITQPRTTMILAQRTSMYLVLAGALATLALIIGVLFAVDRRVTRRLEKLDADVMAVSHSSDFDGRVSAEGDDEIAALADNINLMLAALQEAQEKLEELATHDALTMLYNRRRFEEDLDRELVEHARLGTRGALLWLDIDNFKEVNDSLGHAAGDQILVEFAQELASETRGYATLARIGGDEFALILPTADNTEAEKAADRLINLLREQVFRVGARAIHVQVSVGIALYPDHGTDADALSVAADIAMYEAKESGGNSYRVYSGEGVVL
jgi:diguanylate cyclase (GGDEF)-like protein